MTTWDKRRLWRAVYGMSCSYCLHYSFFTDDTWLNDVKRILFFYSLTLSSKPLTSTSSGTSTSVDPKGYLTSLENVVIKSNAEIGDIKRVRMLFNSLVRSNQKHAPGWIASAALEEHAGRMVAARKIIKQGCEQCLKRGCLVGSCQITRQDYLCMSVFLNFFAFH